MVLLLHWMEVRLIVSSAEDWRRTMTTELTRKKVVFRGVGVACNRGGGCSFCLYIYDSDVRCFYEKRQQCVWCGRLRSVDAKHPPPIHSRLALDVVFFLSTRIRCGFFVRKFTKNCQRTFGHKKKTTTNATRECIGGGCFASTVRSLPHQTYSIRFVNAKTKAAASA